MPQNPTSYWDQFPIVGTATGTATAPTTSPQTVSTPPPTPQQPQTTPTEQSSPKSYWDQFPEVGSTTSTPGKVPETGQPVKPEGIIGKSWDWLNTPLLDLHREGAGGLESGVEDIASGFTSPLSVILTLGTFGSAGLIESSGAAALKAAGLGVGEIAEVSKGAQVAEDALKSGTKVVDALKTAGVNPETYVKGVNALYRTGLTAQDLTDKEIISRGGASLLRKMGISAEKSSNVSKGIQLMVNSGFTAQQVSQAVQEFPRFLDALKDGDYESAKRIGVDAFASGVLGGLGATHALHDAGQLAENLGGKLRPTEEINNVRKNFGVYQADVTQAGLKAKQLEENLRTQIGKTSPERLGAIMRYVEAGGDKMLLAQRANVLADAGKRPDLKVAGVTDIPSSSSMDKTRVQELLNRQELAKSNNYKPKDIENLVNKYKSAMNLTPEETKLSGDIRNFLSDKLTIAQKKNVIHNSIDDYQTHLWDLKDNVPTSNVTKTQAKTGAFSTNVSMARQRLFDSAFEGELLGHKLKEDDPVALAAYYGNSVDRAIAARDFLSTLRSQNLRASDGRPVVALAGTGKLVEGSNGENAAVMVNPERIRSQKIASPVVSRMQKTGELDRFMNEGKVFLANPLEAKAGKTPIYAFDPNDYISLDHPAFRDWNFAAHAKDGTPAMVKADLRVHPDVAEYMKRALGLDKSQLQENKVSNAILKGTTEAKHVLLSFSPFHVAQEGLRALMTGINPFGYEKPDLDNDGQLRRGVEGGLTLGRDYRGIQDYTEGVSAHSKILSKIPVVGKLQDNFQHFLFDKYIPSLKVRAYRSLEDRYTTKYQSQGWSQERISREAAAHTNEVFGGINYKQLGRSAAAQDWFKLAALAPDWLESEGRFAARVFGKEGSIARTDVARMAGGLWLTSRVLNYLTTGKPHNEAPFGVVTKDEKGQEKVYSVRTLPTDMLHMASDPMGFLRGRMSPFLRSGVEAATGRDDRGHRMTPGDLAIDITRNLAPIPAQSILNPTADATKVDQAVKAGFGTVQTYRTEAEKLAGQFSSDMTESGPLDKDALARHQTKMTFEDDVRVGRMSPQQIHGMVETGALSVQEGKDILKAAEEAPLQARASKLPMKEFLQVYSAGTDKEKAELAQLFLKKRTNYLKSARKEMSPGQLLADPTYNKIKSLTPGMPPW